MLRRLYDRAVAFAMRKEVVGTDYKGNTYFRWFESVQGQQVERREVKWHDAYMLYTPDEIPSEWRMWLRKLREKPPTPEEMQQSLAKAQAFRQKVAALDEQERLRQLRMRAAGMQAQQTGGPDIASLLQQQGQKAGAAGGAAQPTPGATSEPTGTGDAFKPGAWRPGGQ